MSNKKGSGRNRSVGSIDHLQSSLLLYPYDVIAPLVSWLSLPLAALTASSTSSPSGDPVHHEVENMTGKTIIQIPSKVRLVKPCLMNRAGFTYSRCMCRKTGCNKMVLRRSQSPGTDQY